MLLLLTHLGSGVGPELVQAANDVFCVNSNYTGMLALEMNELAFKNRHLSFITHTTSLWGGTPHNNRNIVSSAPGKRCWGIIHSTKQIQYYNMDRF